MTTMKTFVLILAFCLCGLSVITLQAQDDTKRIKVTKISKLHFKGVNTPADDFAPAIIGTIGEDGDTLIITSNREKREKIYIIPMIDKEER